MQKCIVGKKIGMTQIFDEKGKVIPVTVVEAGPCVVVQKKTAENDGYDAVQIGFGEITEKHLNKPLKGHFAKADVAPKKVLRAHTGKIVGLSKEHKNLQKRYRVRISAAIWFQNECRKISTKSRMY